MKNYKIEIKWALIFTTTMLTWMVLERWAGLHDVNIDKHPIVTNFIMIPAILIYVFALLDKKKNFYSGTMNYMQAVISGLVITLGVTMLSPFTQYITSTLITPDYFKNVIKYSLEHKLMSQENAESYFNLKSYMIQVTVGSAVMGAVTSLIVAFFTKSKTPN